MSNEVKISELTELQNISINDYLSIIHDNNSVYSNYKLKINTLKNYLNIPIEDILAQIDIATITKDGLMAKSDKLKLESLKNYDDAIITEKITNAEEQIANLTADIEEIKNAPRIDLSEYLKTENADKKYEIKDTSIVRDINYTHTDYNFSSVYKEKIDNIKDYTLPKATKETLGGVIIGDGLNIDSNGKLTANKIDTSELENLINSKAEKNHTHKYAESDTIGGAALKANTCTGNSATSSKLLNKRYINGYAFDGSSNINNFCNTTSEDNTHYIATINNIDSYTDGLEIIIVPNIECGEKPLIKINNLEYLSIKNSNNEYLKAGDLKVGIPVTLVRVGNYFFMKSSSNVISNDMNIFISETEPTTKEGIWIKSNTELKEIIYDKPRTEKYIRIKNIPEQLKDIRGIEYNEIIYIIGINKNNIPVIYGYDYKIDDYEKLYELNLNSLGSNTLAINSLLYFIGGSYDPNTIYSYDINNNISHYVKDLPYSFWDGAATNIDDTIYLFGSRYSQYGNYAYKYKSGTFTRLKDIPFNCYGSQAISIGTNIYIFGSKDNLYNDKIYKYDTINNLYTFITTTPFKCYDYKICTDGIKNIYLMKDEDFYIFNINSKQINKVSNLPYLFNGLNAYINKDIYIFGSNNKNFNQYAYKIKRVKNIYMAFENMPYEFHKGNVINIGKYIYLFGSTITNNRRKFSRFNIEECEFEELDNLPIDFYNGALATYNKEIYMFGCEKDLDKSYVYKYNTEKLTFTKLKNFPCDFSLGNAITINNYIYIIGGNNDSSNKIYRYNIKENEYELFATLNNDFIGGAALAINNDIYCFGGDNQQDAFKFNLDYKNTTILKTMPYNYKYCSAVLINNDIYILSSSDTIASKKIIKYNINNDNYEELDKDIPFYFNGVAIAINYDIYMFGSKTNNLTAYKMYFRFPYENTLFIQSDNILNKKEIKLYNFKYNNLNYIKLNNCYYTTEKGYIENTNIYYGANNKWNLISPDYLIANTSIIEEEKETILNEYINTIYTDVIDINDYTDYNEEETNFYNPNVKSYKGITKKATDITNQVEYDNKNNIQIIANTLKGTNNAVEITIKLLNNNGYMIQTPDKFNRYYQNINELTYIVRKNGIYKFDIINIDNELIEKVIEIKNITVSNTKDYYINNYIIAAQEEDLTADDDTLIEERKNMIKNKLTDKLINFLYEANYVIVYIPSNIALKDFIKNKYNTTTIIDSGIGGITYNKRKTILLTCDSVKPQTTMHEIGHAIDNYYNEYKDGWISERSDYKAIYNAKSDYSTIFNSDTYFLQNVTEYFAQNFAYFFTPMSLNPMDWDGPKNKEYFTNLYNSDWK